MFNFIDKYRIHIGIVLVLIILIGGGILLWKGELFPQKSKVSENTSQSTGNNTEKLQKEIEGLKGEISRLNETLSNTEIQRETTTTVSEQTSGSGKVAGESTQVSGKININTADQKALESLPGIGPTYASRIIEYRNSHGGFKNISEIQSIKGIGPKTYEKIKDLITI